MEEKKWVVYTRVANLMNEDAQTLKKYGLETKKYIYIGQCEKNRIQQRTNDFIYKIYNRTVRKSAGMTIDLETAITYQNIIKFFVEHKDMTQKQVEDYLFRSKENKCFNIIYDNINSSDEAKNLEKQADIEIRFISLIKKDAFIFSNRDSFVENYDENSIKNRSKKNITLRL